jgi:hypothetical protein
MHHIGPKNTKIQNLILMYFHADSNIEKFEALEKSNDVTAPNI